MNGVLEAAASGTRIEITSTVERPAAVPLTAADGAVVAG